MGFGKVGGGEIINALFASIRSLDNQQIFHLQFNVHESYAP